MHAVNDAYALPRIDETLDCLNGATSSHPLTWKTLSTSLMIEFGTVEKLCPKCLGNEHGTMWFMTMMKVYIHIS